MRLSVVRALVCVVVAGFLLSVSGTGVASAGGSGSGPSVQAKLMTRNLYLGADLTPAFAARTVGELIDIATSIYGKVVASDFPERAEALADEIASLSPDVVGLQEAELWRSQTPADFNPVPNAATVEYDFLQLLLDALAARGHPYVAVASITNTDVEAPRTTAMGLQDVRLTDRDVLLARADQPARHFSVRNPMAGNFVERLVVTTPVLSVTVLRGWVSADVAIRGTTFHVVSTHLEALHPGINVVQGDELLAGLAATTLPLVVLGDLNSAADGSSTATYANFLAEGFRDPWAIRRPRDAGFTCCQDEDLRNPTSALTERIDFVLFRGSFRSGAVWLLGEDPEDRTPSGLWPSDHAGVAAKLAVPKVPRSAYLLLDEAEVEPKGRGMRLTVEIETRGKVPMDRSGGAFGYAVLTGGLDNVLVLVTHLGIDDSGFEDPVSGFHTHVLDLMAPTSSCGGFDAEVDLPGSLANRAFDPDFRWRVEGDEVRLRNIPTSALSDASVEAVASFTVTPLTVGGALHLCVDVVDTVVPEAED